MIDVSKIKPGDKITVELTVVEQLRDRYFKTKGTCSIHPDFVGNHIDPGDIINHTPALIEVKVGTKFRNHNKPKGQSPWEVLAIHGDLAWCKTDDPNFDTPTNFRIIEIRDRLREAQDD